MSPRCLFAVAAVAASLSVPVNAIVTTPVIAPQKLESSISLDGRLDEAVWSSAKAISGFEASGVSAKAETSAWIANDSKALYIAFECKATKQAMNVLHTQDQRPVWQDESVELFIAPWDSPEDTGLYQFVVNAGGAKAFLQRHELSPEGDWSAAVATTDDGYTVEIRIPYSVFTRQGNNEASWRILFCRNSKDYNESSSYPGVDGRFANFWNYARLVPPEGGHSFLRTKRKLTPLVSDDKSTAAILPLQQVPFDSFDAPVIIPQPQKADFNRKRFPIESGLKIFIGASADKTDRRAAEALADWIVRRTGVKAEILRSPHTSPAIPSEGIYIGQPSLNDGAKRLLGHLKLDKDLSRLRAEGYVIHSTPEQIVVSGVDQLGDFYGAQSLAQMIQTDGAGSYWFACGRVVDQPSMEFRGAHLLTARDTLEFQTKLIREVLSPFKVKYVILQMDKFRWTSHPEVVDPGNNVSADDLRKLIAFAKDYHITYIPLVMSLGHMEWIFRNGANLDIAEDPNEPYAYCPLNPRSYELMFDLFEEAMDVFGQPAMFHIGHDEFDMRGQFPTHEECKKLGKVELYYRDTLKLSDWLNKRGARVMMWGDILQMDEYKGRLSDLPKDTIICDWRYSPQTEYPSVDLFVNAGFDTIGCTWYDVRNIHNFSVYAHQKKAVGMMATTWSGWEPADVVYKNWPEQMFQYVYSAAWAWNPGHPSLSSLTFRGDQVFNTRWFGESGGVGSIAPVDGELFAVNLQPHLNISLTDDGDSGWLGLGRGEDLSGLQPGEKRLGQMTYHIESAGANRSPGGIMVAGGKTTAEFPVQSPPITVNAKARQLWFLHTSAYTDGQDREVGSYRINYTDGTTLDVALSYGKDILSWTDERPTTSNQTAWQGKAASGIRSKIMCMPWSNPYPDKTIQSLQINSTAGSQASPVLIAVTGIR